MTVMAEAMRPAGKFSPEERLARAIADAQKRFPRSWPQQEMAFLDAVHGDGGIAWMLLPHQLREAALAHLRAAGRELYESERRGAKSSLEPIIGVPSSSPTNLAGAGQEFGDTQKGSARVAPIQNRDGGGQQAVDTHSGPAPAVSTPSESGDHKHVDSQHSGVSISPTLSAGGGHCRGDTHTLPAAVAPIRPKSTYRPAAAPVMALAMVAELRASAIAVHGPDGQYIRKSLADAAAGEVRTSSVEGGHLVAARLLLVSGLPDHAIVGEHRTDEDWARAKERAGELVDELVYHAEKRKLWSTI